jgi:Domain of unknown function (DUF6894)
VQLFFFDYVAADESLFDYRGQEFKSAAGALEYAQEIARDLTHSMSIDWGGWAVEVRAADGRRFYSLPIERCLMSAA